MNEKDRGAVASTSADNGISTSSNVKHPARRSRICKKCCRSVKNLSHHQQEVHGMSKMRRKLDGYLTGEKKAPNQRVKFCPLSPCKRSKTPIFKLDKHLPKWHSQSETENADICESISARPTSVILKRGFILKTAKKTKSSDE